MWSRKWQPTPVFLPGKLHGQRSLVGCSPWGHQELNTTECKCTHICLTMEPNHVRQKLIEPKGEIDESTIIIGNFNTSLSKMDRSSRQKISNDIVELKSTINQLDIIDIY